MLKNHSKGFSYFNKDHSRFWENFNSGWKFHLGDKPDAFKSDFLDIRSFDFNLDGKMEKSIQISNDILVICSLHL